MNLIPPLLFTVLLSAIVLPSSALAERYGDFDQAIKIAKGLGPDACPRLFDKEANILGEAKAEDFSWKYDDGSASNYSLYRIPCWLAAYNSGDVFILFDRYGEGQLQSFAVPDYSVEYENGDSEGAVKSIKITGYSSQISVAFGDFDPKTREITWFNKSRGVGDAYTLATWRFENRRFSLKSFDVDASYDGKSEAINIVKFK